MMRLLVLIAVLAGLGPGAQAAPADEVWRRDGLANPWSAWLDVEHDIIYVANVAGDPQAKDGNGFIAQLDLKGEIVRRDWAVGLDAPKGISGMGGQLYVADIDRIVALDLATGAVTGTWPVPGAQALTDVSEVTIQPADDAAIASDKAPLLPGGVATFANYTSYSLYGQ